MLFVLKNEGIDLGLANKDSSREVLEHFISNSENSRRSSEEQGSINDKTFQTLKTLRDKRIRDTGESPRFQSFTSSRNSLEMSFSKQRNSNQTNKKILIAHGSSTNMFKRRSDMFSFNGENMSTIKSFLSSKKSSSSLGEDFDANMISRRASPQKLNTPEFLSRVTQRKSVSKYKRRMGQFYNKVFLKKIAELPEYDSDEESLNNTKSGNEEDKSNSFKTSNEQTKSNEKTNKSPADESKNLDDESSSNKSSISSKNSSVRSEIKPFM